jgi:hypothetical protein
VPLRDERMLYTSGQPVLAEGAHLRKLAMDWPGRDGWAPCRLICLPGPLARCEHDESQSPPEKLKAEKTR